MTRADRSALASTLARAAVLDAECAYIAGEPHGDGWFDLTALRNDEVLEQWLAALVAGEARGHVDVAASYLALSLANILARPLSTAVLAERRGWTVDGDLLSVRRNSAGWFDGLAVRSTLLVLPTDDARTDAGVAVVSDVRALHDRVAAELVCTLAPAFEWLRKNARSGLPGLWTSLADVIAGTALAQARERNADAVAAWDAATALIDAVQRAAPLLRARPTMQSVDWSGGVTQFAVRGTCCLSFKLSDAAGDGRGDAYCTSCPLREADDRRQRWATWLDTNVSMATSR